MNLDNAYNELKIFSHTEHIGALLDNKRMAPVYIRIKPTNVCNQKCYYCCYADSQAVKNRAVEKKDYIPWDKMQEIIQDISDMHVKAVTFSGGGDPLCYQYINQSLKKIIEKNIDLSMITNGQLLKDESAELLLNAKWIRVSLDSADTGTYFETRGVCTFNDVINNIENFCKKKSSSCDAGINFVVNEKNYMQIYDICKLASQIGVDNIKFSGLVKSDETELYHQDIEKTVQELIDKSKSLLEGKNFKIIDKYIENLNFNRQYNKCYMKELVTVIAADQNVYTCHQKSYTDSGRIGSIKDKTFKELWYSDVTARKMGEFNPKCECKESCVYDQRNILLNSLIGIDKKHINFI